MSHVRQAAKAIAEHLRLAEQRRKQEEAKAAAAAKASAAASKPQAAANAKLQGTQPASSAPSERAAEAEPAGAEDAEAERAPDRNTTEELMERLRGDGVEGCRAELLQLLTSPGATLLPPPEEPRRSQDDDEPAEPPPPPPPPPPQPPPPPPPQSAKPQVGQPILSEVREPQALPTGGEAPQAEVAAAEARPGEVREREEFEDLAWRVLIVRPAAKSLSSLQRNDKRQVLGALKTLANGEWSGRSVKHLTEGVPSGLSLYEYKVSKAGRIIWSVGIDFVPLVGAYQQTIRVWAVHMHDHDAAQVSIRRVCAIHARGLTSLIKRQLRTRVHRVAGTTLVIPKTYESPPEGTATLDELERRLDDAAPAAAAAATPAAAAAAREAEEGEWAHETRYPPAVEQEDAYNLVKFYTLDRALVYNILTATFTEKLEFPFVPDETEHLIINLADSRSILLIGRSGTGKTTIVVQRMWLRYRVDFELRSEMLVVRRAEADAEAEAEVETASPESAPLCETASAAASSDVAGGAAQSTAAASESTDPTEPPAAVPAESRPAACSLHQLFVTANPILRLSVARSFKSLQTGFVAASRAAAAPEPHATAEQPESGNPAAAATAEAAEAAEAKVRGDAAADAVAEAANAGMEVTGSLAEVSEAHWPLFLRAHHWLRLIDGALPPANLSPALLVPPILTPVPRPLLLSQSLPPTLSRHAAARATLL